MLRDWFRGFRFPVETALLAALMFFLPLFEAPKNLAWLGYVVAWIVNRSRAREWGGRWDSWDSLILAWIASAYLVAAFAGLHHSEWGGANDVLKYGLVLWLLRRGGYGEREYRLVIGTLLVSALAGLPHAYWRLFVTHSRPHLEINSVGQVNHTAIYLAIVLGMSVSALLAYWRRSPRAGKVLGGLAAVVLFVSLVVTLSRGGVGIGAALMVLLAAVWWRRLKAVLIAVVLVSALAVGLAWTTKVEMIRKLDPRAEGQNVFAVRDRIWSSAVVAWRRYPVFGVGMDNFNQISMERIAQWRHEAGKTYSANDYLPGAHGHSLLFNTLAERGTAGIAVVAAVLFAWLVSLLRHWPRAQDDDAKWALWGGALSAWFVSVGAGAVNTSLHHEHAILSVTLLGLWLSYLKGRKAA